MLRTDMVAPESVGFLFAERYDVGNSGAELIVHIIHCMFSYVFSVANIQLLRKYSVFLFLYSKYRARKLRFVLNKLKNAKKF